MASQGPLYPAAAVNLSDNTALENKDAWVNPTNVGSDNATEATIVAASYDSPDISQILVASNFGFSVSGTIDGITVEIDRRSIVANSGKDFRVQLATGTAFANLVGTNKAVPATIWPTTSTVATYGGSADTWSASLTPTQVNSSGFAVFLSAQANVANADIGVDFIRVTVTYTPPAGNTGTGAGTSAASASSGAAKETFRVTGSGTSAASTGAGTAAEAFRATAAGTSAASSASGTGDVTASGFSGTGAGTSAASGGTGAALLRYIATAAGTDAASTATGQAKLLFAATGAGADALSTGSGAGLLRFLATGAGTSAASTGAGTGVYGSAFVGSGAGTSAASTASGTGTVVNVFTGIGAGLSAASTATGSGTVGVGSEPIIGGFPPVNVAASPVPSGSVLGVPSARATPLIPE